MTWHETPGVERPRYLFKLKLTANVRRAIARVPWPEWEGRPRIGMEQYAETRVQLEGWSCERRIIVTRTLKPANPSPQDVFWRLEKGDPTVAMGTLASAAYVLQLQDRLARLAAPAEDTLGLQLDEARLPQRIRRKSP